MDNMYNQENYDHEKLENITRRDLYIMLIEQQKRLEKIEKYDSHNDLNLFKNPMSTSRSSDGSKEKIEKLSDDVDNINGSIKKIIRENSMLRRKITALEEYSKKSTNNINRLYSENMQLREDLSFYKKKVDNIENSNNMSDRVFNNRGRN